MIQRTGLELPFGVVRDSRYVDVIDVSPLHIPMQNLCYNHRTIAHYQFTIIAVTRRPGCQGVKVEAGESPALCRNCNRLLQAGSQDACRDRVFVQPFSS